MMTPLMQQYWDVKSKYQEMIVLFRMGDFFEMFHKDAEAAAPILNIALTQRNKKAGDSTKMCGFPHHSIAPQIAKLLIAGRKVAICDQIEDAAQAKGLVKRAVTRVLTPGMVYDPDTLDELTANYLCSYSNTQIAFTDVTTGQAFVYEIASEAEREELIALLKPVELVVSTKEEEKRAKKERSLFSGTVSAFGEETLSAIERLISYIGSLKTSLEEKQALPGAEDFTPRRWRSQLQLSNMVLKHLEVLENTRGGRDGTLFEAVNRTRTSGGARLLKDWLREPLLNEKEIGKRQDEIALWLKDPSRLKNFREVLGQLGDLERRLGKIHSATFNARDLAAIAQSLLVGGELNGLHIQNLSLGARDQESLSGCLSLAREIERTFNDELPLQVKEGGMIRKGVSPELDELARLTSDSQALLLEFEANEKKETGIGSLKVRYNSVFGFYIEITKTHSHKAPDRYLRKQTLTNAERYTTSELAVLEEKILSAKSRRDQLEYEIFSRTKERVIVHAADIRRFARRWMEWDVLSALAWLALERSYCRPSFNSNGHIRLGLCRHPVIEQTLNSNFVPNTVELGAGECLMLTGPNMAGKSTLMRQVGLIAILAQIGAYVPAERAELPLFTEIFTRIGASDALNEGLSTFMVEMSEAAHILRQVQPRSLVILDEIGRGTSTYDGLSLAQAILEYLVGAKRPYLFFATHYHELTALAGIFPQIHNGHMAVHENGGDIRFMHSLRAGSANRSYGIHVAKIAGLPASVTARAEKLLGGFEGKNGSQLSLALEEPEETRGDSRLKDLDLSQMTPLEALNTLFAWQREER